MKSSETASDDCRYLEYGHIRKVKKSSHEKAIKIIDKWIKMRRIPQSLICNYVFDGYTYNIEAQKSWLDELENKLLIVFTFISSLVIVFSFFHFNTLLFVFLFCILFLLVLLYSKKILELVHEVIYYRKLISNFYADYIAFINFFGNYLVTKKDGRFSQLTREELIEKVRRRINKLKGDMNSIPHHKTREIRELLLEGREIASKFNLNIYDV